MTRKQELGGLLHACPSDLDSSCCRCPGSILFLCSRFQKCYGLEFPHIREAVLKYLKIEHPKIYETTYESQWTCERDLLFTKKFHCL